MMKTWRLRTRFMVAYAGLIVLGFAGLALVAGQQISQGAVEDFEINMERQASVVARGLKEVVEHFMEGESTQTAVSRLVTDFADTTNTRISLIDKSGRVWLDSNELPVTANQSAFPEIKAALNGRIIYDVRDNEQGISSIFAAAPIQEDDDILSIVQISAPLTEAREIVWQRWLTLGGGVLLLSILAIAASWGLSASLIRPLTQLRNTAHKMADGDLTQRLPENRQDEIGQLAIAFNHMASQVQAMIDEQRAFASNASHELRTPLTTIRLRSEALREGMLGKETTQQYIIEIDEEIKRMGQLVQDLILLSHLNAGRAQRGREQINLTQLANSLLRESSNISQKRQIAVTLDMPASLPSIEASLTHLHIVFRNLLDNAIKYTPEGGEVRWQMQVENEHLHALFSDTGQGVAAKDLPHLFDRFYRADKARTRQVDGVGLGLSLVQTVVKLYNGRISISSPGIGQGTTVAVWWPLSVSDMRED
ncbi:MAG: cell wall metabolism sensor histidine kinase WalK [Chloroflexi bacterium]|nr:cell wall metabolism sensor histidine kinase WalK [Chloroflexota bacterium]